MENCPKCRHDTLIYDPRTKSARCLQMECQYKEQMEYSQYSSKFEDGEKNIAHKLTFPRNHALKVV